MDVIEYCWKHTTSTLRRNKSIQKKIHCRPNATLRSNYAKTFFISRQRTDAVPGELFWSQLWPSGGLLILVLLRRRLWFTLNSVTAVSKVPRFPVLRFQRLRRNKRNNASAGRVKNISRLGCEEFTVGSIADSYYSNQWCCVNGINMVWSVPKWREISFPILICARKHTVWYRFLK